LLPLFCFSLTFSATAQVADTKATDAYLITRMAAKFHVQPRPLDKAMSAAVYTTVLKELDEERIFFTQGDIAQLAVYQYTLDQEILNRRSGFLQLLTSIYQQRLAQVDTMVDHIAAKPFNFSAGEKIRQAGAMAATGGSFNAHLVDSLEPRLRKRAVVTTKRMIKRILQSPIGVGN